MKPKNKQFFAGIGVGVILTVVIMVLSLVTPTFTAAVSALAAAANTPTPPPAGDIIPLKPLSGITSLSAQVTINVNGLINGKRAQGDLNATVVTNDQNKSQVTVTGSLLGQIAAQVGGSLVGLFTPSSVDIYKVPEGTYIVANSLIPVCVKPAALNATATLDDMSPTSLMNMLTSSDVARGKYVGDNTINGVAVKHYVINGQAFLYAAQNSTDPKLKEFGQSLWSANDADLYVDAKSGYPVAFNGSYSGAYAPLGFEGDFTVQTQLTGVNQNTPVTLPTSCNKPIVQ